MNFLQQHVYAEVYIYIYYVLTVSCIQYGRYITLSCPANTQSDTFKKLCVYEKSLYDMKEYAGGGEG